MADTAEKPMEETEPLQDLFAKLRSIYLAYDQIYSGMNLEPGIWMFLPDSVKQIIREYNSSLQGSILDPLITEMKKIAEKIAAYYGQDVILSDDPPFPIRGILKEVSFEYVPDVTIVLQDAYSIKPTIATVKQNYISSVLDIISMRLATSEDALIE